MLKKYNLTKEIIDQLTFKVNGNSGNSSIITNNHSNKKVPSMVKENVYKNNMYRSSEFTNNYGLNNYNALDKSNKVLAVFTGTDVNVENAIKELNEGKKYGLTFDIAVSESAEEILEIDFLKKNLKPERTFTEKDKLITEKVLEGVSGVIVPMTTQNTIAKLALGIQDTFISFALWQSLWHGKPVLIDYANAIQYRGTYSKQPMLQKIVEDHIKTVNKMGTIEVQRGKYVNELLKALKINNKKDFNVKNSYDSSYSKEENNSMGQKVVITEKDVLQMGNQGGELSVPKRTIVTPLAYDTAKSLGIKIIKV
ncbi:flavoprotein [Sporosalibacterium faouarense]|uniref:flavoprotein n=1 Tax=Sporosalibacterium faouarense TaxID=516123 RepID=UPI00192C7478|nr:flavoprotein [Sporosalibacterium faouarense]